MSLRLSARDKNCVLRLLKIAISLAKIDQIERTEAAEAEEEENCKRENICSTFYSRARSRT